MYVFMYIFLFIHSLTPRLLWLFVVIKKIAEFFAETKQKLEMVQLLALLGVQTPWRPGEFLVDLHVLPASAWDVFADTASSHILHPTCSFLNIFFKQYFPSKK